MIYIMLTTMPMLVTQHDPISPFGSIGVRSDFVNGVKKIPVRVHPLTSEVEP